MKMDGDNCFCAYHSQQQQRQLSQKMEELGVNGNIQNGSVVNENAMKIEQNAHLLSNGGVKRNFSSMDDESDETMTECCPHGFQERKVITY